MSLSLPSTDSLNDYARFADFQPPAAWLLDQLRIIYMCLFFRDECVWNPIDRKSPLRQKWLFREGSSTFHLHPILFQSLFLESLTSSPSQVGLTVLLCPLLGGGEGSITWPCHLPPPIKPCLSSSFSPFPLDVEWRTRKQKQKQTMYRGAHSSCESLMG